LRQDPPSQFALDRGQNAAIHRLHETQRTGRIKSFLFLYLGQLDRNLPIPADGPRAARGGACLSLCVPKTLSEKNLSELMT